MLLGETSVLLQMRAVGGGTHRPEPEAAAAEAAIHQVGENGDYP